MQRLTRRVCHKDDESRMTPKVPLRVGDPGLSYYAVPWAHPVHTPNGTSIITARRYASAVYAMVLFV